MISRMDYQKPIFARFATAPEATVHLTTLRGMEEANFREAVQEQVVLPLQEELQSHSWVESR
jgi:hypothetical protein